MESETIKPPSLSKMAQAYIEADYNSRSREDEKEDAMLESQMPTPDTDKESFQYIGGGKLTVVRAEFARKLERRLAVSKIRVERLRQALAYLNVLGERI